MRSDPGFGRGAGVTQTGDPSGAKPDVSAETALASGPGPDLVQTVRQVLDEIGRRVGDGVDVTALVQLERLRKAGRQLIRAMTGMLEALPASPPSRAPGLRLRDMLIAAEARFVRPARRRGLGFHAAPTPDLQVALCQDGAPLAKALAGMLARAVAVTRQGEMRLAVRDQGPGLAGRSDESPARLRALAAAAGALLEAGDLAAAGRETVLHLPRGVWEPALPGPAPAWPDLTGRRVLLVEGEPESRAFLHRMLGRSGATVTLASDGI